VAEEWKKEISAYTAENEISGVIKFTSFEGCKGLAADYVFIVGLHETVLPKKEPPSETDVCKFIVALTRTKKQCHILTCQRYAGVTTNPSCFIKWLSSKDVSHEYIDAQGMKALRRED
jgi:superfamily I DNA/RNA helicase